MYLVIAISLCGCAEQTYLSERAQELIDTYTKYGPVGEQNAISDMELQTNRNNYMISSYDIKDVEESEKKESKEFDLSGPVNIGITETTSMEESSKADASTAQAKGVIYLIPLGVSGGSSGTLGQKGLMKTSMDAYTLAKTEKMDYPCVNSRLQKIYDHSTMSSVELKKHIETVYTQAEKAIKKATSAKTLSSNEKDYVYEWCALADSDSRFEMYAHSVKSKKYFTTAEQAVARAKIHGFGFTDLVIDGYQQYEINWDIAAGIKKELENKGFSVYVSREDKNGNAENFSVYMNAAKDKQADMVVVIGTNCNSEQSEGFVAQYCKIGLSDVQISKYQRMAKTIAKAVKSGDRSNKAAIIGISSKANNAGIACSSGTNYFLAQQDCTRPVIYCECGTYSKSVYGTKKSNMMQVATDYSKLLANGIANCF